MKHAQEKHPIFIHCPRGRDGQSTFMGLARKILANKSLAFSSPDDVVFVLPTNIDQTSLLEQFYISRGCTNYVVVGRKLTKFWKQLGKIKPLLWHLRNNSRCQKPYVVFTDAFDTILFSDPSDILERFEKFDCDIVLSGTKTNWPNLFEFQQFEASKYASSCYPHVNSGGIIGKRLILIDMLEEIMRRYRRADRGWWWPIDQDGGDQLAWKAMHMCYYPRVIVDSYGDIFGKFDPEISYLS